MHGQSKWSSGARMASEAIGGALVGAGGALLLSFAGSRLFAGANGGWGDLIAAILGAIIGYTIGVSIGVYLLGRRLGRRGSYWLALLGSGLGAALVLLLAEPLRLNANTALLQGSLVVLPPILATLGFNLSLKARR